MKYLLFSLMATALFLVSACDTDRTEGSGNVITDDRTAGAFTTIDINDAFEVTIRQGPEHRVSISADDNIISSVNTSTSNGTLSVGLANGNYLTTTLLVEITTPQLERIEMNDAVRAEMINFVSTNPIIIDISDATKLDMSGSAPSLELDVDDASEIKGFDFTTGTCNAELSDASKVDLTVSDRLEGRVRDASTFRFKGNPDRSIESSGASSIIDAN